MLMAQQTLFIYGSLRDDALREVVLGRPTPIRPATLPDHCVRRVAGETFPMVVPSPGDMLEGALMDLDEDALARVSFFEDEVEFGLTDIEALADGRKVAAQIFTSTLEPVEPWDFELWRRTEQPFFLECAREIMALYEIGADWSDPGLWPGVKMRAQARVNAAVEPARRGVAGLSRDRIETDRIDHPYAGFFAVEEHYLRHPRFDGAMTPTLKRSVFVSGDAVTVMPYDAARDTVLLVSQWRAGPHARGDRDPWPVEVVAGRVDGAETPEATARREAEEEAGVTLGRMRKVAAFYTSPGAVAEHVTAFVGEADLSAAGGDHGLPTEDEDIRTFVLPLDEALEMVENFEANTSPVLITLLWLARHRAALRAEWSD
jgi:nudix-type nucleoside diphosphatase (YffH/AdpP family)